MKKVLLCLLTATVLVAPQWTAARAEAAELKPVAVVSLPGYNNLLDDAAYLGKLADRPELDKLLTGMMAVVTQGKELVGLDRTRPWGAMVQTDGETLFVYGFLPVTNLKKLLAVLEPNTDGIQRQEDGLYLVKPKHAGQKRLYVKEQAGWAFLSDKPEQLAATLADPTPLLAGIVKRYEIAVRVAVPRVPVAMREMFLAQVRQKADRDLENQRPDESPADFALRKKVGHEVLDALSGFVNDANVLTLGWALDKQAQKTFLDLTVTAREGTATAAQLALVQPIRSALGGFRVPGAAFTASGVGRLPAAKIAILDDVIDAVHAHAQESIEKEPKSAEHKKLAGEVVDNLTQVLRKTIDGGHSDTALSVLLDPKAATLVAGTYVADGTPLGKAVRAFKDLLDRENPTVASWVKLDAEHSAGVTFHEATIPIPADAKNREKVVRMFGPELHVVLGIGPHAAYLAAGRNATTKMLKQAIEASEADATQYSPLRVSLALEPVTRFAAAFGEPRESRKAALAAEALRDAGGLDHLNLEVTPVAAGVQYRLEVEPGVLRMIGRLTAARQSVE